MVRDVSELTALTNRPAAGVSLETGTHRRGSATGLRPMRQEAILCFYALAFLVASWRTGREVFTQ